MISVLNLSFSINSNTIAHQAPPPRLPPRFACGPRPRVGGGLWTRARAAKATTNTAEPASAAAVAAAPPAVATALTVITITVIISPPTRIGTSRAKGKQQQQRRRFHQQRLPSARRWLPPPARTPGTRSSPPRPKGRCPATWTRSPAWSPGAWS